MQLPCNSRWEASGFETSTEYLGNGTESRIPLAGFDYLKTIECTCPMRLSVWGSRSLPEAVDQRAKRLGNQMFSGS